MNVHTIAITSHARYLVSAPSHLAPPHPAPSHRLLVGFHGYKENAVMHLDVLRSIAGSREWTLVSVQAPNRFYDKAVQTVASWMTREDRELVIADNIAYVAAVVADVRVHYGVAGPLVYAGFSQGVAMAYRAAAFAGHACDGLIVLAGDVPPDVAPVATTLPAVLIGRGATDAWYTAEKSAKDIGLLRSANVTVAEHVFDGGHVWDPSFVARAGSFLDQLESSVDGKRPAPTGP